MKREGFWRSSTEPDLPMPVAGETALPNRDDLLAALEKAESQAAVKHWRGWSTCRICKKPNGTKEFSAGGWVWPEGFRHYIEDHHVSPSADFQHFILRRK